MRRRPRARSQHDGAWLAAAAVLALFGCTEDRHSDGGRALAGAAAPAPETPDAGTKDASPGEQGGMRAPAPLDGGRTFGMRPDAVFGVRRPNAPRSSARIVGWALDLTRTPIRDAAASAGGAAVASDSGGFFVIDEVYGQDEADVFVSAFGRTRGHVRVPIRDGQTSYAIVVLAQTTSVPLADASEATNTPGPDAGAGVSVAPFSLRADAEAFVTPWRETATGPATLRYAVPTSLGDAAAAPASLLAIGESSERERLRARGLFEVRVEQVGVELALVKPAQIEVQLWANAASSADAGTPGAAADRLYWFDEARGAFVARGEITEEGVVARGEIDRLGHWAIGRIDASERTSCRRLRVQDESGAPLPFAAVHVTSAERFDSAQLVTGADGSACWQEEPFTSSARVFVVGASAAGLVSADALIATDPGVVPGPGACGDDPDGCAQLTAITAEPLAQACVRGVLSHDTAATVRWLAVDDAENTSSGALDRPGPFCLALPRGAELTFSSVALNCPASLPRAPAAAGVCGASDCLDLGTVECCNAYDLCDGAADEDCDGTVDEGCTCGTTACGQLRPDACCTTAEECGARAVVSKACLALEQPGRGGPSCPMETLMLSSTETYQAGGCCRPDGECGLLSGWGCIARAQASEIWPIDAPLAAIACTY